MLELDCADAFGALALVRDEPQVVSASLFGRYVHLLVENSSEAKDSIAARLRSAGLAVEAIEVIQFTLEDAFIRLTEKAQTRRAVSDG